MKLTKALMISLLLSAGCAPKNDSVQSPANLIASKYFSMRPQQASKYIGIVQLKIPALLTTAKTTNGKTVVDEKLKAEIISEQEYVIAQLKEISPDIEIIATYKLVLNAVAFTAPESAAKAIEKIEGIGQIVENTEFDRPQTVGTEEKIKEALNSLNEKNSVTFIGADKLHEEGITGKKMTVGVIDTGVDYTHAMMGGPGSKDIYKAIDPALPTDYFPNKKVVGGMDFVGSDYAPSSDDFNKTVPRRDLNPIDESGHGTHVAGSVAGIGDGVHSYNGVAPDAEIYALKVFGKKGGTSDIAVIQALEYAADPTESLDINNRLDVINLSLGGGFGKPKTLYSEAIANLVKAGTVVVASAGNSGDTPYITGAPATSDEAISVGASIDNMSHNIEVNGSSVEIDGDEILVEAIEGSTTAPVSESNVKGTFVYLGTASGEIAEDLKKSVKGKIALIDRGVIGFQDKFKVAQELGASGVVVVNNVEGAVIVMGGEGKFDFPSIMITKIVGDKIKAALKANLSVEFDFNPGKKIERTELIDTMTAFSSRGPRSMDSLIKPEIAGPGYNVISAASGEGDVYVKMSGTSMSGPHLAGVMALMRDAFPTEAVAVLKARILNTAKILTEKDGTHVGVARQGAGRVQVKEAYKSKAYAMPATLSLGEVSVASLKTISKKVVVTNTSDEDQVYSTSAIHSKNIKVNVISGFRVKAKSSYTLNVSFSLKREDASKNNIEADGFVILTNTKDSSKLNLPFLAVLNKVSAIKAGTLVTHTDSLADRYNSEVTLKLENTSKSSGDALIFNLLGTDKKKTATHASTSTLCDLEAAGMRVIERQENGESVKLLQFGVKLYDSMTSWQPCDVSVQFDFNGDGLADQELVGIQADYVSGITTSIFASLLLDAPMARDIRLAYELDTANVKENYMPALQQARQMFFYDHSNVAVIEVEVAKIQTDKKKQVGIKVATTHLEGRSSVDDFLGNHEVKWQKISLRDDAFAFNDIPELITVKAQDQTSVSMRRGLKEGKLLVLYPHNTPTSIKDEQSQIITEQLLK